MRRSVRVLGAAVPLVLAVAGCSGGGTGSPAPQGGAGAPAGPQPQVPAGVAQQYATVAQEIKDGGGETTVGPWRIGYIVENAEPWFEAEGGHYHHRPPAPGETHHIEIIPFEASTGRIVPNVPIRLEVLDATGKPVDAKDLNFYYSEFFHYANNFAIPQPGKYTLHAVLQPPTFLRHGKSEEQPPLGEGAEATFRDVEFKSEG